MEVVSSLLRKNLNSQKAPNLSLCYALPDSFDMIGFGHIVSASHFTQTTASSSILFAVFLTGFLCLFSFMVNYNNTSPSLSTGCPRSVVYQDSSTGQQVGQYFLSKELVQ